MHVCVRVRVWSGGQLRPVCSTTASYTRTPGESCQLGVDDAIVGGGMAARGAVTTVVVSEGHSKVVDMSER